MNAQEKSDATAAAKYLGSLSRGIPKRITPADAKARSMRLAEARKKRWPANKNEHNTKANV